MMSLMLARRRGILLTTSISLRRFSKEIESPSQWLKILTDDSERNSHTIDISKFHSHIERLQTQNEQLTAKQAELNEKFHNETQNFLTEKLEVVLCTFFKINSII
jgi:hypothetical protein